MMDQAREDSSGAMESLAVDARSERVRYGWWMMR